MAWHIISFKQLNLPEKLDSFKRAKPIQKNSDDSPGKHSNQKRKEPFPQSAERRGRRGKQNCQSRL